MKVEHKEERKLFSIVDDDGQEAGIIEYMVGGDGELYATHTEVYPEYEGNGYASQLLDALVDYAKEKGVKLVPLCGYVIGQFKKHPEKYSAVFK